MMFVIIKNKKNGSYCKSIKGKHYLWLDEYEQMSEYDLQRYLDWCNDFKNKKNKMYYNRKRI